MNALASTPREDRSAWSSRKARYALQIVGVAAVYTAAGKLGLDLAFENRSVTAVWAPTGIALVALILGGYRLWPGVALGALVTNIDTGVPAVTVLGITCGNTLEALTGAYLLTRFAAFRPSLERVRDVLSLVACGALISTVVSATVGVASLIIGGSIAFDDTPTVWRTWWLGDMGGDLIVAPALLIAAAYRPLTRPPGRSLEAVALAFVLAGVSVLLFSNRTNLVYVIFPLLIWAALRFWQPGAAAGSLLVAAIAVAFTANGKGPFAMQSPDDRLLLAQTFVAVAGVSAMVLAAVTSERRRAEDAAAEIATTLQESLLPRTLPALPQMDSATYFRPAGKGHRVGGDFYDVFLAGDGRWGLAVGDVVGKGPRAAALTALARYTLRAASIREQLPSRVLASLNDAVRRQDEAGAVCTAIYATLDTNGSTPTMTVSSGGHPLPLVLRSDGSVEQVGEPGTLLGVDATPSLSDYSTELGPGESVLFYTDGLIDAFAPRRVVELSELESVLRSCTGRNPAEIVAAVEQSLLASDELEPRDDVAIVVLQVDG
ncbi:MAG: two-component system, NarL family, sensor histidine kinase FusK [Solirubrobacteraceae bacterium]|nr:two-component system, NarL family, sensor histidine kinase FusK [Solirubrobacteraceae bacterium]